MQHPHRRVPVYIPCYFSFSIGTHANIWKEFVTGDWLMYCEGSLGSFYKTISDAESSGKAKERRGDPSKLEPCMHKLERWGWTEIHTLSSCLRVWCNVYRRGRTSRPTQHGVASISLGPLRGRHRDGLDVQEIYWWNTCGGKRKESNEVTLRRREGRRGE